MIASSIKYFFMNICCFYFFSRFLNIEKCKRNNPLIYFISAFMTILLLFVHEYALPLFVPIAIVIFSFITIYLFHFSPQISFITTILSYSLSYFTFLIAAMIISPLCVLLSFHIENHLVILCLAFFLGGILQLLLASIPFRFRRLQHGMPFLTQERGITPGLIISFIVLLSVTMINLLDSPHRFLKFFIAAIGLSGFLFIIWWIRKLMITYLHTLRNHEIDSLKQEISKLEEEISHLSHIIHKDNKLIPAMEMAVKQFIASDITHTPPHILQQTSERLLEQLEQLSSERKGILRTTETTVWNPVSTGFVRIDAIIHYMQQKAADSHANFFFVPNSSLRYLIQHIISEENLATILADLIENALIATKHQSTQNILLCINVEQDTYCIDIFDNGTSFAPEVIQNLGVKEITTHKSSGGSGIGLMTLFRILNETRASFSIDEQPDNVLYTKKLTLRFDNCHQIIVRSQRKEVLKLAEKRNDITFVSI